RGGMTASAPRSAIHPASREDRVEHQIAAWSGVKWSGGVAIDIENTFDYVKVFIRTRKKVFYARL
ncbi:hypothetical protein, partial [Paracoccus aminovorans]|uniref:hypothetical protein n=1 Tax=Paracoccus aminovorans TaxID=34004 RepID=UPI001B8ADF6A